MAALWKNIGGEPFLINPHLAVIGNPKKGRKMAATRRRKTTRRNPRRRTRTRRAKRNPFTVPGPVMNARKRGRKRRRNPGMIPNRRRKSYRRNPAVLGMQLPALQTVAYVGIGFVGTPIVEGFIASFVPATFATSTIGKYVIRIGSVLGLTWLGNAVVGRSQAAMISVGGGLYMLTSLIKDFAPGMIPGLGATIPGIAAYQSRLSAYQSRLSTGGMGSYNRMLGAPNFGARNTVQSANDGGMNVVAQRYRRFQ